MPVSRSWLIIALFISCSLFAAQQPQSSRSALQPVYGPLAEQIASEFNLANMKGVGIDIGSGPGDLIIELCKRTKNMHWVNADIDPSVFPDFIKKAEEAGFKQRVSAIMTDVEKMPFHDNYAEVIVSRGSFQFWKDLKNGLSEINRVLSPGGVAFIGRGFPDNFPLEIAQKIREQQKAGAVDLNYDVDVVSRQFKSIMESLSIEDYRIRIPKPPNTTNIKYGIWLEFHKPSPKKRRPPQLLSHPQLESEALSTSISTVDQAQIEKQGAKTIVDALNYTQGALVESRGRKVRQFVSFRGQQYPYPEYAVNGSLFREFGEVPYFFSTGDVERIEILRSSAALLTGIAGLAGVINIVPREYQERQTSLLAEYGSLNSYRIHASHGQKIGNVSYGLGIDGSHTDGPEHREGAENMLNLFTNANWKPRPNLSFQTNIFYMRGKRELVQAEPPAAQNLQDAIASFDPTETTAIVFKTLYRPSRWASTQFTLGYSNRHNVYIDKTTSVAQITHDYDREWNLNLIQSLLISRDNVIRIGANYNHWIAPYGTRFYTGRPEDLETGSASVVDEQSFGRLLLDGGLRYQRTYINEYGAYSIEGSASGFAKVPSVKNQWEPAQLSGSLGATYQLTDQLSLRGNFLSGVIEPRRGTLAINLAPPKTEDRTMVDAGIRMDRDNLGELTLTGFYIKQKNAIVLSGATKTVNGRIMELYDNRDQDTLGAEFEFRSRPVWKDLGYFLNVTSMMSRARFNHLTMDRNYEKPQMIMGGGVLAKMWGLDYNFFWKYVSAFQNVRFAAVSVPQPLGDFASMDLNLSRTFGSSERLRIYLEMTNLTDNRYSTVVGYPDYGRRFQLGIKQIF
jgi:outer membrane receptor protein involved in Fe transport